MKNIAEQFKKLNPHLNIKDSSAELITVAQGDVLIICNQSIPGDSIEEKITNGRKVVEHGESGNIHRFENKGATILKSNEERFIKTEEASTLKHEEHDPIVFPPGEFKIRRQREYSPEAIRNVLD